MNVPKKIHFGALAPPLTEQLDGLLPRKDLKRIQALADAITMCKVHSLIGEGEATKARRRLTRKIEELQMELLQPKGSPRAKL